MSKKLLLGVAASAALIGGVMTAQAEKVAAPEAPAAAATTAATTAPEANSVEVAIRANLAKRVPHITIKEVLPTKVDNMYEVRYDGGMFFIDATGRFIADDIYDLETQGSIKANYLASLLKGLTHDKTVNFTPKGEKKHEVIVFTDIDCGFCRKLHFDMAGYHERGIEVRYAFFPRAGINSDSGKKLRNVWCAADPVKAMDDAKNGRALEDKVCETPMQEHMGIVRSLGIRGTPSIYTPNGQKAGNGYLPPDALLAALEAGKQ